MTTLPDDLSKRISCAEVVKDNIMDIKTKNKILRIFTTLQLNKCEYTTGMIYKVHGFPYKLYITVKINMTSSLFVFESE
jgi:hypothetical protein